LGELAIALRSSERLLKTGGRLVVISFQPTEDRICKEFLQSCVVPPKLGNYLYGTVRSGGEARDYTLLSPF
jgi:16S rRNA C1402 N4-methylase RsmH